MKKKRQKKTLGAMGAGRVLWAVSPVTRVKPNKKGKGSYKRQDARRVD